MRVASNSNWVSLSKWRKIEYVNDTLYFETFGKWRDSSKAKINFINSKEIQFIYNYSRVLDTQNYQRISDYSKFEDSIIFWSKFRDREENCFKSLPKSKSI